MKVIVTLGALEGISEKERKEYEKLSSKDSLYIMIGEEDCKVPVGVVMMIAALKTEVTCVPAADTLLNAAFLCGVLGASAKGEEIILVAGEEEAKGLLKIASDCNVKLILQNSFAAVAKRPMTKKPERKRSARAEQPQNNNQQEMNEKAEAMDDITEEEQPDEPESEEANNNLPNSNTELSKRIAELLPGMSKEDREKVEHCCVTASDANIGFQFLLTTTLGKEAGDYVWKKLKDEWSTLHALGSAA